MKSFRWIFVLFVMIGMSVSGAPIPEGKDNSIPKVRAVDVELKDRSGVVGQQIYYLLQKQLGSDLDWQSRHGNLKKEPGQISCLSKSCFPINKPGEKVGEGQIRPLGSMVFAGAVALRYGQYDQSAVGMSKEAMEKLLVSVATEVAAHHVANTDKSSWWWGDDWQSALWTACMGAGVWLMWDRFPQQAQRDIARMIIYEADRFLKDPAPFNEYDDTKAEENAWNSDVIALAYAMFPEHPRRAAWGEKAKEYMVTSYATPQDVKSEEVVDGKPLKEWLRGPNAHSDYTVENHGFSHPDYQACFSLLIENVLLYRMAREEIPQSCFFNVDQSCRILNLLVLPNGWFFYPQSTDWSNYRQDVQLSICCLNSLRPDPVCARILSWTLDFLRYADSLAGKDERPSLFRFNWACSPSHILASVYLMHYIFGPGAEPMSDKTTLEKLSGTRLFEQGKYVVCRTPQGMSSFSWFDSGNRLMGAVTPLDKNTFAIPILRGLVGFVEGRPADKKGPDPIEVVKREVELLPDGGYVVGLSLVRGWNKELDEKLVMVALPDGRTVYAEKFWARGGNDQEVSVPESRSGLVCMEADPYWRRGVQGLEIHFAGGKYGNKEEKQDKLPPLKLAGSNTRWLNIGDRFGIVMRGNKAIDFRDANRHLELALNYRHASCVKAGEAVSSLCAAFYPKATREETEKLDKTVELKDLGNGIMMLNLGDKAVILNLTDKSSKAKVGEKALEIPPLKAVVVMK